MKNNIVKYIILGVFVVLIYVYYLYMYAYNNFFMHSDNVSPMLMMDDILKGNLILKDWTGSTGYFLTGLYFFSLVPYYIFGLTKEFYLYNQTFVATLIMFFILILLVKNSKNIKITLLLFFTLLLILPEGHLARTLTDFAHHNETYMILFADLLLIYFIYNAVNKKRAVIYSVILFIINIAVYADTMMYYIYAMPIILVILYNIVILYKKHKDRIKIYNLSLILIATILSIIINKAIEIFVKVNGGIYRAGLQDVNISNPADWNDRLKVSLEMLLSIFNFRNFSHPLDIISLLIFILCVFYLFKTLITIKKADIIQQFLALSSLLFFVANIVSYVVIADRYFDIIAIMMLVLLIYSNPLEDVKNILKNKKLYQVVSIFLVIVSILFMVKNIRTEVRDISIYDDNKKNIKEIVVKHNLKHGYATFWNADVFSFYSGPEVIVAPVYVDKNSLIQMKWLSKNDWYNNYANFIVTFPDEVDSFYDVLGKPKYEYRGLPAINREETIILIYDKNLTEYFPNKSIKNGLICSDNASKVNNIITIQPSGYCYGPYISLEKGRYKIKVTGENLSKINFDAGVASKENGLFKLDNITHTDKEISYEFNLDKNTDNVEFRFFNNTTDNVTINNIDKKSI